VTLTDQPRYKYLLQGCAIVTTVILTADLLVHTWFAYVNSSSGTAMLFPDIHWSIAVGTITILMLPELLDFHEDLLEGGKGKPYCTLLLNWLINFKAGTNAFIKFMVFPLYLSSTTAGFHIIVELFDVVSFIYIIRDISQGDYDTTRYLGTDRITIDIRILLFILLMGQVLVWLLPISFLLFRPRDQHKQSTDQRKQSKEDRALRLESRVLVFSMVVEILTDFPELLILFLWGGWRGQGSSFVVVTLMLDVILTGKSVLYNPWKAGFCKGEGDGQKGTSESGTDSATDTAVTEVPPIAPDADIQHV